MIEDHEDDVMEAEEQAEVEQQNDKKKKVTARFSHRLNGMFLCICFR